MQLGFGTNTVYYNNVNNYVLINKNDKYLPNRKSGVKITYLIIFNFFFRPWHDLNKSSYLSLNEIWCIQIFNYEKKLYERLLNF